MICNTPRIRSRVDARRGIVLMIMLSLLALFTVMAVTFVVASGQFRRGANIASRAEQMGDPFDLLLQQAMMQIVRGSTHPHSAIGPHGLLEDMYGNADAVTGCVVAAGFAQKNSLSSPVTAMTQEISTWGIGEAMLLKIGGVSFGWDRLPGNALGDDDNNGVVDDISEIGFTGSDDRYIGSIPAHPYTAAVPGASATATQVVDNVDNYYSGRVITFVSGPAAGQSCYIVRSKVFFQNGGQPQAQTLFYVSPPQNGKKPGNYDRFVINGRPFNGSGFGSTPYLFDPQGLPGAMKPALVTLAGGQTAPNPRLRMLDQPYHSLVDAGDASMRLTNKIPIAFTPNPVDPGYREYLAKFAPLIDADEDYDIPDVQNMMLAGRQWNNRSRRYDTIAPSLHRPDLVNYVMYNASICPHSAGKTNPRWIDIPPAIRRRICLRPDPVDHYDYTQENVLNPINSDGWTPGEPFVDVNGNGTWDPYVVSLGGPEQFGDLNGNGGYDVGDRAYYNTNFDAVRGPWDVDNDGDGEADSIWVDLGAQVITDAQGRLIKPLFAVMVLDLDGRINLNAHGTWQELKTVDQDFANLNVFPSAIPAWDTTVANRRPKPTSSQLYIGGQFATEERNVIGAYAYGTSIAANLSTGAVTRVPMVQSPLFQNAYPGLTQTQAQTVRWAGAYMFDYPFNDYQTSYTPTAATSVRLTLTTTLTSPVLNKLNPMRIEPAFGQGYGVHDVNLAATIWANDYDGLPYLTGASTNSTSASLAAAPGRANRLRTLNQRKYGDEFLVRGNPPGLTGVEPRPGATRTVFSDSNSMFNTIEDQTYQNQFSSYQTQTLPNWGDDNIPTPPTGLGGAIGNSGRDAFNVKAQQGPFFLLNGVTDTRGALIGDYGSPGDFDSDGAVGLDLAGQPLYLNMGTTNETIDEPSEMALNRRFFPAYTVSAPTTVLPAGGGSGGFGTMAYRDAPFTPSELERVLRIRDPGSNILPKRLDGIFGDDDWYMQYLVTTESWDIPCPHIAPTPELAGALKDLGLPVNNPTLADLLKARFYLAGGRTASTLLTSQLATVSMRSYLAGAPNNISRLLSADLGVGLRMDVNAPFGNSLDDDPDTNTGNGSYEPSDSPGTDPNGVVDEPGESNGLNGGLRFDGNRDGFASGANEMARQQYAKELYCLMMLLIDENYAMPVQQAMSGATTVNEAIAPTSFPSDLFPGLNTKTWPGNETVVEMKAKRWLTAHRIAQWAINAVDFRDRDSIMTPFEFDVDPFNNNDSSPTSVDVNNPGNGGTWDVNGDLVNPTSGAVDDENMLNNVPTGKWFRGVVWGCEYPDMILSETLAYHDRRTQNTMYEVEGAAPVPPALPVTGTNKLCRTDTNGSGRAILTDTGTIAAPKVPPQPLDPHWDQTRVPEGNAFIELYATGNPNNPVKPLELYTNGELDLSKYVGNSPVWRLAITQGRIRNQGAGSAGGTFTTFPNNDVAMRLAQNPGTCSLDPADPGFSILPWVNQAASSSTNQNVTIERVVTFCSSGLVAANTISATLGLNITTSAPIDTYSAYANLPTASQQQMPGRVPVGRYILVTPHRNNSAVPSATIDYESELQSVALIGDTMKEGLTCTGVNPGNFTDAAPTSTTARISPPPMLATTVLTTSTGTRSYTFLATSPNGSTDYPIHQYIDASVATLTGLNNFDTTPNVNYNQVQDPIAFPCVQATGTSAGTFIPQAIGFNISEPTLDERRTNNPYQTHGTGTFTLTTHKSDWANGLAGNALLTRTDAIKSNSTFTNQIYDDVPWDGYDDPTSPGTEIVYNPQLPYLFDHTTLRYKSVFLQRLANPLRPWDRYTNPYITVDWMPFDLTVFNGAPFWLAPSGTTARTDQLAAQRLEHMREPGNARDRRLPTAPALTVQAMADDVRVRFGSRQRGAPRYPHKTNYSNLNLWGQPDWLDFTKQGSTLPPLTNHVINNTPVGTANYRLGYYNDKVQNQTTGAAQNPTVAAPYYFFCKWQDPLQHTLGYINEGFHYRMNKQVAFTPISTQVTWPMIRPVSRSGGTSTLPYGWMMGIDFKASADRVYSTDSQYVGAPWRPFNWLTWNNRPYSSAMELMLVPAVGPSRLLYEFDMRRTSVPANIPNGSYTENVSLAPWEQTRAGNHYLPPMSVVGQPGFLVRPPFGHLLNFFESSSASPGTWGLPATAPSPSTPLMGSLPVTWSAGGSSQTYSAGNFFRIFEFLHVPTRYSALQQVHRNQTVNSAYTTSSTFTEHPGWPFIAPFNALSLYREPGRVNLNTMPVMPNRNVGAGNQPETTVANNGTAGGDYGSPAWRSVTNDFFPKMRLLGVSSDTSNAGRVPSASLTPVFRAKQTLTGGFNRHYLPWNPSQTTVENFHNLYASLHSDNPFKDPRGPNTVIEFGGDDTLILPLSQRCDEQRPQLFNNPFRSYLEGYSAVAPAVPVSGAVRLESYVSSETVSGSAPNPFLQIDSTLLRRRDTTWNPWDQTNTNWPSTSAASNSSVAQYDAAFDPLFALNFPRPFLTGQSAGIPFTGYSINMLYRSGTATASSPDNIFGSSTFADNYLSRTTDYRNTDRSAFFRYQLYNKLGTIATTRSNVYAIWVTVGYFEVERVDPTQPLPSQETSGYGSGADMPIQYRFPDGYKIVREMGSDTGEVERHKAFAIFDRTIPVGALRGENLNADQAFLVRRILY